MDTSETTEEVSSVGMEKREERRYWRPIVPFASEKSFAALNKALANLWSGKKMSKNHKIAPRWLLGRNQMGNPR
jgi:hypothetical protein